jgi:hypothetical protein
MITREELIKEYNEWRNNYLSPSVFSEHRGMTEEEGKILIELSRLVASHNHPEA